MEDQHLKKLIKTYLDGNATPAEQFIVESWLESFQQDPHQETQISDVSENEQLAERIIAETLKTKQKRTMPLWKILSGLAAAFLLVPTLLFYYLKTTDKVNQQFPQTYENYATGVNQLKRILLPDSTIVYLNANSSLEVPRLFNERTERKVRMTGEAFFEVTKDPKRPFKIEVEELQVKVLGTSFNVKAYRQLKNITVAVVTGKVNVNKDAKVLSTLIPNQELTFNRETHTYEVLNIQANENDWRNGVIVLNKSSFKDLDIAFFNTYGIHLATKDEKLLSERYNLTIRSSRTEEQTLKQLCEILDKKYRKEDKTVIIY